MSNQSVRSTVIYGYPATGLTTTTPATTGCPAHGLSHHKWASCGLPVTGAGVTAYISGTRGIGDRTWVSTAASTTASATAVLGMRAADGKAVALPTTLM